MEGARHFGTGGAVTDKADFYIDRVLQYTDIAGPTFESRPLRR